MKKALLIDGNSVMYRAYFATAIHGTMTNSKGLNTNCIYSFYNMMNKLNFENYDYVMIAFDKGKKTKRHELLPSYKEGRKSTPSELIEQIPYVKQLSSLLGAYVVEQELVEADDFVGTASNILAKDGVSVEIFSSDKDLLQLVQENVIVNLTKKGVSQLEEYNVNNFKDLTGLTPSQIIDYKGLTGDASDNLKGIPGIGDKTALKLLETYGTIENILENINDLKGKQKENILNYQQDGLLCKQVATIDLNVDYDFSLDKLTYKGPNIDELMVLLKELEFNSIISKFQNKSTSDDKVISNDISLLDQFINSEVTYFHIEYEDLNYHKANPLVLSISDGENIASFSFDKIKDNTQINEYFSKTNKICFDLKSSIVLLSKYGIIINNVSCDVLLKSYIDNPDTKDDLYSVASAYNVGCVIDKELYTKNFDYNETDLFSHSTKKLRTIIEVYSVLNTRDLDMNLLNLEMNLSYVLASMEIEGIKVNKDNLNECKTKYSDIVKDLESKIYLLAGQKFNISSPKQLGEVLFEKLNIPVYKKTKTGAYATGVEVLQKIKDYEVVQLVLEYRKFTKLLSTYIEGIEKTLFENEIHTIYKQALTTTGRLSSVEPNMQNLPVRTTEGREIRKMFIPKNGVFLGLDYSQIELRVLASLSKDKIMLDAFNTGKDIHNITASKIKNIDLSEVTSEDRRIAKAVNFGIIYGQTPYGLSEELEISFIDAKDFIMEYFKTYPTIKDYLDGLVSSTEELGYTETILKRKRYIRDINSSNKTLKEFAKRTSMNAPIQGSAADILKLAMVKLHTELEKNNLKSKIVLQIHDELIIDVFEEELPIITELAKNCMENAFDLGVKLEVDYKIGNNIGELK